MMYLVLALFGAYQNYDHLMIEISQVVVANRKGREGGGGVDFMTKSSQGFKKTRAYLSSVSYS